MIQTFLYGISCGILLSFMVGPVFFGLLQTSIQKGFKQAAMYALGVFLSDFFFIGVTYTGVEYFINNVWFIRIFVLGGGSLMLFFGISYLIKKPSLSEDLPDSVRKSSKRSLILKGFLLNAINPAVFFFWFSVVSSVSIQLKNNLTLVIIFFSATLLTVLSTDILKSYFAHKIKHLINIRFIVLLNRILGVALILFALKLFYDYYQGNLFHNQVVLP